MVGAGKSVVCRVEELPYAQNNIAGWFPRAHVYRGARTQPPRVAPTAWCAGGREGGPAPGAPRTPHITGSPPVGRVQSDRSDRLPQSFAPKLQPTVEKSRAPPPPPPPRKTAPLSTTPFHTGARRGPKGPISALHDGAAPRRAEHTIARAVARRFARICRYPIPSSRARATCAKPPPSTLTYLLHGTPPTTGRRARLVV